MLPNQPNSKLAGRTATTTSRTTSCRSRFIGVAQCSTDNNDSEECTITKAEVQGRCWAAGGSGSLEAESFLAELGPKTSFTSVPEFAETASGREYYEETVEVEESRRLQEMSPWISRGLPGSVPVG